MSRIGNLPINVPEGVEVILNEGNSISVKSSKGILTHQGYNSKVSANAE